MMIEFYWNGFLSLNLVLLIKKTLCKISNNTISLKIFLKVIVKRRKTSKGATFLDGCRLQTQRVHLVPYLGAETDEEIKHTNEVLALWRTPFVCECSFESAQRNPNQFIEPEVTRPQRPTATIRPQTHTSAFTSKQTIKVNYASPGLGLQGGARVFFLFFIFYWSCQSAASFTVCCAPLSTAKPKVETPTLEMYSFIIASMECVVQWKKKM